VEGDRDAGGEGEIVGAVGKDGRAVGTVVATEVGGADTGKTILQAASSGRMMSRIGMERRMSQL
jgi:hypothetical protein